MLIEIHPFFFISGGVMKCVYLIAFAIITLSACAGGNEKTIVDPPPPPRVVTVSINQVEARLVNTTFPNSLLSAIGTARDNSGNVIAQGFHWTLDGASVGETPAVEKTVAPGTYNLCLEVFSTKNCTSVTVFAPKPIQGSVFLATETNLPPAINPQLVACSWKSGETSCVDMDASMNYSIVSADFLADTSYIFIRCKTAGCGWKPSFALTARRDSLLKKNVVLLPEQWKIQCGTWTDKSVQLSLEKAYSFLEVNGVALNVPFFFRMNDLSFGYNYNFHTWQSSSIPIPVALDKDSSDVSLLPNDSTVVMNSAQSLSENFGSQCFFGKPLFRAASLTEIGPTDRSGRRNYLSGIGIQINNIPNSMGGGTTNGTNLVSGAIFLNRNPQELFLAQYVIKHELVHTLGFGHGNGRVAWQPGLMTDSTGLRTTDPLVGVLIAEEVAHMQAYYRVREVSLLRNACGIACIHQGERVSLGLPLQRVFGGGLNPPTQVSGQVFRNQIGDLSH